jgi:branched-chain amino acid transport system permease protein
VLSFLAGMAIERSLIRHFEGGETLTLVIVTLGMFILLNSLAGWIWGFENRGFPSLFPDDAVTLGGVRLSVESLGIVAVLLGVVGLLFLLFQRTKIGLAMRAAALNPESSALVGVRVGTMLMLGWGLAAALGALAGVLVAPRLFLDVNLMGSVLIYAFAAAALGGFDSALGAVVGGWIIGVSENLAGTYVDFIGADLKILVPLGIIFVVLLVRPAGLFGTREVARA